MNRIREFLLNAISLKNISIIYTSWIVINYLYLSSYLENVSRTAYYGDLGLYGSLTGFLSYIILTFSLVTFAYFLWVIWFNREHKGWLHDSIRIIISALILYIVVTTPYWFKNIYEDLPCWKFWDSREWLGVDCYGNPATVGEHPALARFGVVSLFSYISCIIISVFIYLRESSREPKSQPDVNDFLEIVVLYVLYGIASNAIFFIVSSPCFVMLAMARFRIIPSKIIRSLIYVLVIIYALGTIAICGIYSADMSQTGAGPVSSLYLVTLLGLLFNVWFYIAVFIGLIWAWIKNKVTLNRRKTFFNGFVAGFIVTPILLLILTCVVSALQ